MANGMSACWQVLQSMARCSFALRLALLSLLAASTIWGQFKPEHPPAQQPGAPTFSVRVNLVRLLVSVKDASGGPLTSLDKRDFHVLDDNVPQDISVFERNTSLPLSVAILMDTSGSVQI